MDGFLHLPIEGNDIVGISRNTLDKAIVHSLVHPVLCQRDRVLIGLDSVLVHSYHGLVDSVTHLKPCSRTFTICLVQILDAVDQTLCFFSQSVCGFLHRLVLPFGISLQFIEVFQVTDPQLVRVSVIFNGEP